MDDFVLAIETGILGGSLSLLKSGVEVEHWTGNQNVSRAEDVLEEINKLLTGNKVEKRFVRLIAVSNGPGSFTGLRIGSAIALGLRKSIGCILSAQPVLESMHSAYDAGENTICAVPFGKNQMCWQFFVNNADSAPADNAAAGIIVSDAALVLDDWKHLDFKRIILHEKLFDVLNASAVATPNRQMRERLNPKNIVRTDKNLAVSIGLKAIAACAAGDSTKRELIYPTKF